ALGMPRLVIIPARKQARLDAINERARLRRQILAFAHDDAIAALRKVAAHVAYGQSAAVMVGDADAGDDRDAESHRDVLLDHFPAADFDRDAIRHAALLEHEIDEAIGREALRWQDQAERGQI